MIRNFIAAVVLASGLCGAPIVNAALIPVDGTLFSVVLGGPGNPTWSGNNLTFSFNVGGGGVAIQTPVLNTSILPADILGISFELSESFAQTSFFSFGYLVRDSSDQPAGGVNLISGIDNGPDPFTRFVRDQYGLGGSLNTPHITEFLGANYSPFSLRENHIPLDSYPMFHLDFRATSSSSENVDITLSNVSWIVEDALPSAVPLPPSAILFGTALFGLGVMRRRRAA